MIVDNPIHTQKYRNLNSSTRRLFLQSDFSFSFQIYEHTKTGAVFVPDSTELKSELSKIVVGLGNLDPLRQLSDVASLPSFVHAIQPMLVCEALLRPASDLVKVFP